nr:VPg [Donkey orchid virus A]
GFGKRQRQKLKFRRDRDNRDDYFIHGDEATIRKTFGEAYTVKGKKSGHTRGMGTKKHKFTNMYGFDPTEYSQIRFLDPLTGVTIDSGVNAQIDLIQDDFGTIRMQHVEDDLLERQAITGSPGIKAFFLKHGSDKALEVDLTPHRALMVGVNSNNIAGYPEREGELRQTSPHSVIDASSVPKENPYNLEQVKEE